jgi:hypothetical protein
VKSLSSYNCFILTYAYRTSRASNAQKLRKTFPNAGTRLEIVEISDILMPVDEWLTILKGKCVNLVENYRLFIRADVDAVIHVASPVHHPGTTSEFIYKVSVISDQLFCDKLS